MVEEYRYIDLNNYHYDKNGNIVNNTTGETGQLASPEVVITPKKRRSSFRGDYDFYYNTLNDLTGGIIGLTPILSDAMDAGKVASDVSNRNYLQAGLGAGMLLLPNILEKPVKGVLKLLINKNIKIPQITPENAASITPEQWTAAQDAAIARGDMAEAQRLRDLHFKANAPNTKTDVPLWSSSEEAFNSFDLSHFGETDSGFFGYGHYLTPIEKYAATYHPVNRKFYANIENPYIGSNDQYFNRIQYVKDRLAMRKENVMRNLRHGKLTKFSKKLGINENTSLEDAERLVDKYIADETVKWNDKYVKYADEFEGKDGVLSWRELQGTPNKQKGIYREVVIPRGEQIKSASAVTYDDNGIRIPLGERDNFNINDIRYGLLPVLGLGTAGTIYGKQE